MVWRRTRNGRERTKVAAYNLTGKISFCFAEIEYLQCHLCLSIFVKVVPVVIYTPKPLTDKKLGDAMTMNKFILLL